MSPVAARVSPARAAAFAILQEVAGTDAHSDDLLHGPRLAPLSQADRDLAMALVLGVLRWQIALDARVAPLLSRPDLEVAEPVAVALRMGAFQLLHMERIPPHAALNESVELVRTAGQAHAAGMVNAILRRLSSAPPVRKPLVETVEAMAQRLGHPRWLAERWAAAYGRAAAEAICGFDQQQPRCDDLFPQVEGETAPAMDAGSRLVAELAAVSVPAPQRIWDCCAAPGGKTMILAQRHAEAEFLATDVSGRRLRRLRDRLTRELPQRTIQLKESDAALLPPSEGLFDLILCDVPCSGTGTLARNPEIRHRLRPEELRRQAERQRRLLEGALKHLAPSGRLVYATCSLEPEENEQILQAVLAQCGEDVARVPVGGLLARLRESGRVQLDEEQLPKLMRGDALRTLPGVNLAADGFFAAVLERTREKTQERL